MCNSINKKIAFGTEESEAHPLNQADLGSEASSSQTLYNKNLKRAFINNLISIKDGKATPIEFTTYITHPKNYV